MLNSKPWYFSKTIWASLVAIAAAISSYLGLPITDQAQMEIVESVLQLITAAASAMAIYGRVFAIELISDQ